MIIIDAREPEEIRKKLKAKTEYLVAGDYHITGERGNVAIERKTLDDFVSSIRSGRLWQQLHSLKVLEEEEGFKPLVLVEGEWWKVFNFRKMNLVQWYGLLQAITIGYGIPVIFTKNMEQTVVFLKTLANRLGRGGKYTKPVTVKKKGRTVVEQAEDMLCGLDLIGRKKAQEILEQYTVKEIVQNPRLLYNIRGIGEKVVANFIRVINARR